jgi:phage anti-repressor protein
MLEKIKTNFTETEQQMFVSSFYCYLNFNSTNDFVIDLDNIWKWMGFSTKQHSKTLLKKNFEDMKDYKILLTQLGEQDSNQHGGHNKEKIMLTVNTFKRLCMKAGTKKADEVHNYFIKLEEILHEVLKEESEELKKQLQIVENEKTNLQNENIILVKTNEKDKHTMLCQQYDKKRLVYIMKLETLNDGSFIIKIGETSDIKSRCQAISALFGIKVNVLELYPCDYNYEFEQFLHKQPVITKHKYKGLVNKSKKSTETYLIPNMNIYNKIKQFIQRNVFNYNSKDTERLKYAALNNAMELFKDDKQKLEEIINKITSVSNNIQTGTSEPKTNINNIIIESNNKEIQEIIENTIDDLISPVLEPPVSKPNSYSPKVQIYDPNDITKVVNVFDSIMEATRNVEESSYSNIKYAARHKTIYKGYRWNLVINSDPNPFEPKDIGKSVHSNEKRSGFVAMLDLNKTKIIKVFELQKQAAEYLSTHKSLICNAIRYGSPFGGYFWSYLDDIDKTIIDEYLKENELPIVNKKSKGTVVQQINPHTDMLEREFPSITDAMKEVKISAKTIKRSSLEDISIGGWKWKIL